MIEDVSKNKEMQFSFTNRSMHKIRIEMPIFVKGKRLKKKKIMEKEVEVKLLDSLRLC